MFLLAWLIASSLLVDFCVSRAPRHWMFMDPIGARQCSEWQKMLSHFMMKSRATPRAASRSAWSSQSQQGLKFSGNITPQGSLWQIHRCHCDRFTGVEPQSWESLQPRRGQAPGQVHTARPYKASLWKHHSETHREEVGILASLAIAKHSSVADARNKQAFTFYHSRDQKLKIRVLADQFLMWTFFLVLLC